MNSVVERRTIFALSSGAGRAGIAIVRVSGPAAGLALKTLAGGLPLPRKAVVRTLASHDGVAIDRAMMLWFPGPNSATGEDVAEFHLHGSSAVIESVFAELQNYQSCVLAEPGEFIRRAFDNGKLDLVEVEGLADLLEATGEAQRRLAMRQFLGEPSAAFERWREQAIKALSLHEAAIDFVDEDDVAANAVRSAGPVIALLKSELEAALLIADQNSAVREGLRIVIAGAPNVGKSSLINALAKRDVAIVTPVAGTTRDVLEAPLLIAGVKIIVADTAGIRKMTDDQIEAIGIERAKSVAASADILVWVESPDVDSEVGPPREPEIRVLNKSDLELIRTGNENAIRVSVRMNSGIEMLRNLLTVEIQKKARHVDEAVVVRQRHVAAVEKSIRLLNKVIASPDLPLEILAQDLREVVRALGSITGHVDVEELLGNIFASFCIGK